MTLQLRQFFAYLRTDNEPRSPVRGCKLLLHVSRLRRMVYELRDDILFACYTFGKGSRECHFSDSRDLKPRLPGSPDSFMISDSALLILGVKFEL